MSSCSTTNQRVRKGQSLEYHLKEKKRNPKDYNSWIDTFFLFSSSSTSRLPIRSDENVRKNGRLGEKKVVNKDSRAGRTTFSNRHGMAWHSQLRTQHGVFYFQRSDKMATSTDFRFSFHMSPSNFKINDSKFPNKFI